MLIQLIMPDKSLYIMWYPRFLKWCLPLLSCTGSDAFKQGLSGQKGGAGVGISMCYSNPKYAVGASRWRQEFCTVGLSHTTK